MPRPDSEHNETPDPSHSTATRINGKLMEIERLAERAVNQAELRRNDSEREDRLKALDTVKRLTNEIRDLLV